MLHVDEGALHAYLDGALDEYPAPEAEAIRAHLDACAECAGRLEVERRIRSDAHAMLGLAAPVVELPSLEELRAYVQRTAKQRRGISRLQRMGWAASVVLALGAGWMLRDGQLQSRAMDIGNEIAPRSGVSPAAAPSEALEESPDAAGGAFADDANSPVTTAGVAQGAVANEPVMLESGVRERSDLVGGAGAERGVSAMRRADPSAVEVPTVGESETAPGRVVSSAPAEEVVARDADLAKMDVAAANAALDERLQEEEARLEADPVREVLEQTTGTDVSVPADAVAVAMAPASGDSSANAIDEVMATEEARSRQAREASAAPQPVLASARTELGVTRGNADAESPSRSLMVEVDASDDEPPAEPLLSVPGHEVVDVTNLGEGSTAWGARVRQRMEDGRGFEVFHLEPGIDPSILPPMDDGVGEASAETTFGWVLVRGAMDDGELSDLLLKLFPESP